MATASHSMAVKSLNNGPGRKRYTFKTFSQRIEEIDIDVFRSLDPVKSEPSEGSSFLRDCLLEWRELNTAEDFISFYEEMVPWVQTLPQVLLHKETIMSKLLARLQYKARLSLEPILRLIAALSRDVLEDFLPFLQRIVDSLLRLLESGAEREPEVVEQIFTSWSTIVMHLQKYLTRDINYVLKVTIRLRYYPKDYIQEFMAGTIAILLKSTSAEECKKGIRKIILEAVKRPSHERKSGVSILLWHVMRGTSSTLHSRAEQVLRFLLKSSTLSIGDKCTQGSDTVAEVVNSVFERLCEEFPLKELNLMWNCLFEEISGCVGNGSWLHLSHLMSILVSTVRVGNGSQISDYKSMLDMVMLLIHKVIPLTSNNTENHFCEVVDRIFELMAGLVDGLLNANDVSAMSSVSLQWAPVFELRNKSLVTFIGELVRKDSSVSYAFRKHIISALDDLVKSSLTSSEEIIYLMLTFFEKLKEGKQCVDYFDGISEEVGTRMCTFFGQSIQNWISDINDMSHGDLSKLSLESNYELKLAVLWGTLACYPHVLGIQCDPSLIMNFIDALDRFLMIDAEKIAGVPKHYWQSLVGAALASYHHLHSNEDSGLTETSWFLDLAKRYKSSSHVLHAVAELLDHKHGLPCRADYSRTIFHPEFEAEKAIDAINVFSDNLCRPQELVRSSTLRILRHYESLDYQFSTSHGPAAKKLKTEAQPSNENIDYTNVIEHLYDIEATPLQVSTSRRIDALISKIQMGLSGAKISLPYVPLVLSGLIGIFHKRFERLWKPAMECFAVLMDKHVGHVWDKFVRYLEICQIEFLAAKQLERVNDETTSVPNDLIRRFNSFANSDCDSTPCTKVLSLLLQSLQKVPAVAESRSRQIIPLFFNFLGYASDDIVRVESFTSRTSKGKEWREVLKEWLNYLKLMKNPKSLYRSEFLKEVLIKRLLDDNDVDVQMKVLDCLLNWKLDFMLPYGQHMKNLITSKNLREELATWSLSRGSNHIQERHRADVIPLIVRLLIPKVRNMKTLASRKNASVHHRRAVLCFLGELDAEELSLFFSLLVKPLLPTSSDWNWSTSGKSLAEYQESNIVKYFTPNEIADISWKKKYGVLHVIEDILKSFDEFHIGPYLKLSMGLVVRILESCSYRPDSAKICGSAVEHPSSGDLAAHESSVGNPNMTNTAMKHFKDLRSLCLKIISYVITKYEDHDLGCEFWDMFFISVKPLIVSFKQEGSSSEKPSSLFSCFLAMSRSQSLVSLLAREESLVPDIFTILTVKKASNAIISSVLCFIENLLKLDNELDNHQEHAIKKVLLPNLETLIFSLHVLFQGGKQTQRKSVKWFGKAELRTFKLLLKYIVNPLAANQFVDILLPFLGKKADNPGDCLEVLHLIQGILPVLGGEATGKILSSISPMLIYAELEIRTSICNVLSGLAANDPSVAFLANLVNDLNAISKEGVDELDIDYSTRTNAYESIKPELFSTIREEHVLVIMSHCVYDLSSGDFSLRESAKSVLVSFVQFSAQIMSCEPLNCQEITEDKETLGTGTWWTKLSVRRFVKKFILKHMGEGMNKEANIQSTWMALLKEMVLRLPQIADFNSLRVLCSEDAEIDFFNNILHLQKHRRAKALSRFRNAIAVGNFSEAIIKRVFVPLFFKMMFDVQSGKGEHVRDACLESLAAVSGHMQWESYYAFLLRCFKEMTFKPDKHKILLRLICAVLDHFHFSEVRMNEKLKDSGSEIQTPGVIGLRSTTTLDKCVTSSNPTEVQTCLQNKILPKIQKLLVVDSENVNVITSLAALKILKLLPIDAMESQLSSIIHRISNFLKHRLESVRDEARVALAACSKELGIEYLQFIVKVMRSILKRGYELHVLGYTLNFILSKALLDPVNGRLDYCMEELLSVAENDILGDVAEEKEVEKIASKMKETRKRKSFETLKLVAQSVTFKTHAMKLLSPIKANLQKHLTPKRKAKLEVMLNHIATGIECNPSVDQTDLFVFVYGLIEDGIKEQTLQGKDLSMVKLSRRVSGAMTKTRDSSRDVIGSEAHNSHLITVFALGVLQNRLKSMKLDKKDDRLLSMLDPFVKLLGNCLSSKYEVILTASLRCLTPLVRLPLPSLESQADSIKTLLLDIAQKSGTTSSALMQSCLSLLTVLLRSTRITLSNDQLRMLIQFPLFVDLERNPSFLALSLLKSIVSRTLVVTEIYDVVKLVAVLMVTSQVEAIRKKCSEILLQFLLDYPLSINRVEEHLDFLLANLSYEHSSGREAVLEMLRAIIVKSRKNIVDSKAHEFFLHLVVCLANDQDNKVRSMAGAAIKLLIEHTGQQSIRPILDHSLSWYTGEKQNLWSAAAQVLGLLVEALKKGFRNHITTVLPVVKRILKSSLDLVRNKQPDHSNGTIVPLWKETYYSLVMLEKMLFQFPNLYFEKDLEEIWGAMCEFLLHPHMWIRNISNRLISSYFEAVGEVSRENSDKLKLGTLLLMEPSRLFTIAVSLCCQLKASLTDDVACKILTQNLVFTVCGVHSLSGQRKGTDMHKFWSNLEMHEQGRFLKAYELLGSRKGRIVLACLASGGKDSIDQAGGEDLQSLLVSPLLKRMGKVAFQMEDIQMKIVFNSFRMISSRFGQEGCQQHAVHILLPLYKVCEGFAGKVIPDDVKLLAEEVRDHVKGVLGFENFIRIYNDIRKNLKAKRDKRKHEEKVMAVVNPMRNAKRKLKIAAKHRANKKRKIMTMKTGRWTH